MRSLRIASLTLVTSMLAAVTLVAQAPAGSTGTCNDGTYTTAKTKSGACSAHGGVKVWVGTPAPAPKPAPKPAPAPKSAPPPAPTARPANATGQCGDGSFTTAKSKSGACSSHGGVSTWFAAGAAAAPAPPPPPASPAKSSAPAPAPAPKVAPVAGAPAAATALCNDGTYSESQHRSGTCSKHKGVKQWLKSIPPG